MKITALSLLFLVLTSLAAVAQTTYDLPATPADFTNYVTYVNLFVSDIPVKINGVNYAVSLDSHAGTNLECVTFCYITFQNLTTYEGTSVLYAGSFSTIAPYQPTTLSGTFSGAFSGSFVLNLVPITQKPPCYHGCRTHWVQQDSTLTLQ